MDSQPPSYPECQDLTMAERPTSFSQQEILAPLQLTKGELIYVAKKVYIARKVYVAQKAF
jgi:hypothetical protein